MQCFLFFLSDKMKLRFDCSCSSFLRLHANLTKGFGIMGPKEFFPLLDFAFMPKNALTSR